MDSYIIGQRRITVESTLFWFRCRIKYVSLELSTLHNELWAYYQLHEEVFDVLNKTLALLNVKAQEETLQTSKVQTGLETEKLPLSSQENVDDKRNNRVRDAQRKNNSSHAILTVIAFFILPSMSQEATAVVHYRIEGCYPCTELINREWRQDLSDKCTSTIHDCGKCLEGYQSNNDDEICQPKAEINVTDSSFAVVPNGTLLTLNCQFKENVDCVWKRRGHVVEISNRYSYTQTNNGVSTKDCSIKIFPFNGKIDHGLLECESKTDGFGLSISTSAAMQLYSEKTITADESYSKVLTEVKHTVIIQCNFNQSVDCAWNRRGHELDIHGRYSYLNANNGIGTKDCSIKITSFREIDCGLWQCQSVADSSTVSIFSTSVELLKVNVKYPAIIVGPNTTNALIGDKVKLTCQFDAEVQCIWQHNDTEVDNTSRYYSIGDISNHVKKDCIIELLNFDEDDVGNWTCTYKGAHTNTTAGTVLLNIPPMHAPTNPEITITNTPFRVKRSAKVIKGDAIAVCVSRYGNPAPKLQWIIGNEHFESNETITRNGLLFDVKISMNLSNHQFEEGNINIMRCIATHPMFEDGGTKEDNIEIIIDEGSHNRGISIIIAACVGVFCPIIITSLIIWFLYRKCRNLKTSNDNLNEESPADCYADQSLVSKMSNNNETRMALEYEQPNNVEEDGAEKEHLIGCDLVNEDSTRRDRENTIGTLEQKEAWIQEKLLKR